MRNCNENLPEEYENDGNTYCHGIVNCKYYHDECTFMDMGSGNPDDMPCRVQEQKVIQELQEWREERQKALEEALKERPQELPQVNWGKWIIAEIQCPNCFEYFETDCYSTEELNKCPHCGADMRGDKNEQ